MEFTDIKESFNFKTTVKSCTPAKLKRLHNGKKETLDGFEVILEDSVLFPEGGGQPDDRGFMNTAEVLRVTRRGAEAVHFVPTSFEAGAEVELKVDWDRRWDHMQQHSGQHLVTAIADSMFGFPTTSWNLGDTTSFIELDTPSMTSEQLQQVEAAVNERIRACVPMYPTLYAGVDDPALSGVRTRGLPDDHVGPVRVVTIEGIENNTCCGTHVSNLAHLQAVKLLAVEKGKKDKVNLVFVAGERLLKYAESSYQKEKAFTATLRGGPDQHVELLEKLSKAAKDSRKHETTLLRDMAKLESKLYHNSNPKPPVLAIHRKEGDMEFLNMVINEVNDETACIFVTCGDEKGSGMFMLSAATEILSQVADRVLELLEGKGAVKKNRLQGKAGKLNKRAAVIELVRGVVETGQKES